MDFLGFRNMKTESKEREGVIGGEDEWGTCIMRKFSKSQ